MKVIILNSELKEKHINLIKDTVKKVNADVCFVESEDDIPP